MADPSRIEGAEVRLLPCRNKDCPYGRPKVPAFELYGKTYPTYCEDCQADLEQEQAKAERSERVADMLRRSGATPLLLSWSLETLPKDAHRAREKARSWLEGWLEGERRNLVLYGPVGTRKTGLAWGLIRELIEAHLVPARFANWRNLLAEMQRSFDVGGNKRVTTEYLQLAPVVCLDDLGAEQQTDWRRDELATLIEHRHHQRRATIFTTNYLPSALAERLGHDDIVIGQRLVSRINEGAIKYEMSGQDRRA